MIRKQRGNLTAGLFLLFISLFTILIFWNTLDNDFVNYDDDRIILKNSLVKRLSWINTKEIFTSLTLTQYFPLVIFSHSLEYAVAGLSPHVYHVNNLILHVLNGILFFWLIHIMKPNLAAATIGALLFCIHPLHVEPVAWISARRDVLSTLFFLETLITYCYYLRAYRRGFYTLALLFFLFSLLSKPMAVTIPVALILLDYRYSRALSKEALLEKIPFFLLSIPFAVLAIVGDRLAGNIGSKALLSFTERLLIAGRSIIFYLGKTLWPAELSVSYSYRESAHILEPSILMAFILLAALGAGVIYSRKRTREIVFGASIFFFTLLPVLDIIPKAGAEFVADRYMYIPSLGLFYLVGIGWAWLHDKKMANDRLKRSVLIICLVLSVGALSLLTYKRNDVWQNSGTLWRDVISKYPEKAMAHNNLGVFLLLEGEEKVALKEFKKALLMNPISPEPYNNLGIYHGQRGEYAKAIIQIEKALALSPDYPEAINNLGMCHYGLKRFEEAISIYKRGLSKKPDSSSLHNNLGNAYMALGKLEEAVAHYKKAIFLDPDFEKPHDNLGILYARRGMFDKAIAEHQIALSLEPGNARIHYQIAVEYFFIKNYELAANHCDKAIALGYRDVEAEFLDHLEQFRRAKRAEDR